MGDWLEGDIVRKKDPEAAKWFGRVAGWLRRHGIRHQFNGQFLMREAATLIESGSLELAQQWRKPDS
jgi:hypothetical protein